MIVGVDSRVLVGSVMKGRSSSYKLNGILRSLTSLLVCYRIYLALPWIGTKSNSSDYPSRMVDLPPQPSASPDVVDLVGPVFAREHLVAAPGSCVDIDLKKYESSSSSSRVETDPTISNVVPHANAPTRASSCVDGSLASTAAGHAQDIRPSCRGATVTCPQRFPNLKELRRRVDLCLSDGGQYMQRNICCRQLERLYHVAPSDAKPGGLGSFSQDMPVLPVVLATCPHVLSAHVSRIPMHMMTWELPQSLEPTYAILIFFCLVSWSISVANLLP